MKLARVQWEVAPINGVLGWSLKRNGVAVQGFLFQYRAVKAAESCCRFEWDTQRWRSELTIKGKDGKIKDRRTYGEDPKKSKG